MSAPNLATLASQAPVGHVPLADPDFMTAQTGPPLPDELVEASLRLVELREAWLARPGNYPPPRTAPAEVHAVHRERWMRSAEFADAMQLLRNAQQHA